MDPLYASFVGAIARWVVTLAIGFLVAHHIIAVDQTTYFVDGFTHKLVVALPLLLPLAWSLWNKYRGRVKFLTALESPAGTTEAGVVAKIGNGMGASVKTVAILLACVLGSASLQACGPKQYHTAVVANTSIAQAVFALQDAEIAAHKAGLVTDAKHTVYKAQILTLLEAGDDLTMAMREWDPSRPAPVNVARALSDVSKLLVDLRIESPQATNLLYAVQAVISVLRGSGVLPSAARQHLGRDGGIEIDQRFREQDRLRAMQTIRRGVDVVEDRLCLTSRGVEISQRQWSRERAIIMPVQASDPLDDVAVILVVSEQIRVGGTAGVPHEPELLGDDEFVVVVQTGDSSFASRAPDGVARELKEVGETGRLLVHAVILLPEVTRG